METLFFYFAKVILCSGVMFLYYIIFLKDKTFHHYNRFYLLGTLLVSMLLPLVKVDYFTINLNQNFYEMMVLFQNNSTSKISTDHFSYSKIIFGVFALISLFLLIIFGKGLLKINRFKSQFPRDNFEGISFFMTNLENAPFSYFRNLFWKDSILLQSDLGKQILKHEMVHIEQKHSYDKILIEILTAIIWFNPMFYLIRKEINLIHEYLADKKALKNTDTKAFAKMLLEAHFSGKVLPATSPFLNSNLKKRIIMLKKSNTKFSYWRKVFALPLLFMLVFSYMVKAENREISKSNKIIENQMFNAMKKDTTTIVFDYAKNGAEEYKNYLKKSFVSETALKSVIRVDKFDTINPTKKIDIFPNPMTINLCRSSDYNSFYISGKEVSKKEFIAYFVKYNTNPDYSFGATSNTYTELETAGKIAIFMAGKNEDLNVDSENVFDSVKKYGNEKLVKKSNEQTIFTNINESMISSDSKSNKYLKFFTSAQNDFDAYYKNRKDRENKMISEIKESNEKISSKVNFYNGRNYELEPLTKAEIENLKKQADNSEKIRKKYATNPEKNGDTFVGFKPKKSSEVVYDISGLKKKETEVSNDQLLLFPNFSKDSEYYLDGKKVSKEIIIKLSEDLFAVEDFFKKPPTIKSMKREMVTNGKKYYLMKLELFTK